MKQKKQQTQQTPNQKTPIKQSNSNRVILGRLGAVYGVRGWLKVISFTDPIAQIFEYPNWQIEHGGQWQLLEIEAKKPHGNGLIIKIAGIDDRDIAKTYTNNDIAINRDELETIDSDDEFYWTDLIGLNVENHEHQQLGTVLELRETGSNDVLIVQHPTTEKRTLIPFTSSVISKVDLANKHILVDWPDDF